MENTKPVKSRIPSKNHIQYDSLRYVSDVAAGPTCILPLLLIKNRDTILFSEVADTKEMVYSMRPLGQTQSKKPVT